MSGTTASLRERREAIVREHVEAECQHDIPRTLATFHHPRYEVVPFGGAMDGAEAVTELLRGLMTGFPDFRADFVALHHADSAVIMEGIMSGTHNGPWAGLSPTGRKMQVPFAGIFLFEEDRLLCERVYFDAATLMGQLNG